MTLHSSGSPSWLPVFIVCCLLHNVLEARLAIHLIIPPLSNILFSTTLSGRKLHCSRSQSNLLIYYSCRL
ncbi:hypothetical protein FPSE5266_20191 [Fusarium pseudograminearum]|nr:hypothetical protein FPSE5266_20191 [Fusarium pseudograminearum]